MKRLRNIALKIYLLISNNILFEDDIQEKVDFIPNPVATDMKVSKNNYNIYKRNDEKIRLAVIRLHILSKSLNENKNFYMKIRNLH